MSYDYDRRRRREDEAPVQRRKVAPGKTTLTSKLPPVQRAPETAWGTPEPSPGLPPDVQADIDASFGYFPSDEPVQARADGDQAAQDPEAIQAEAAAGVDGPGGPLPHLDAIQASFGSHDVTGVTAHVGGEAGRAAENIGAEAYATGDHVAFRGTPDLHTAAHEAAHVIQQRGGVHLKGGVGEVGDGYEQHADAVADKVVRGESAEDLLAQSSGGGQTEGVQGYWGEEYVDAAIDTGRRAGARLAEGISDATDSVMEWGVEQIEDAGTLLEYISSVSAPMARQMIVRIARFNREVLVAFLRAQPAHQLATYIASQFTVDELVALAIGASQELRRLIIQTAEAIGLLARFFIQLHIDAAETALAFIEDVQTEHLPALLQASGELASEFFNHWWPANTGLEGQLTLTAGAKVPVWPEPPISVGGEGEFQGELKLYNKPEGGAPAIEFEVGAQQQRTTTVGLTVPEVASVDLQEEMQLAQRIKTTTRFAEVDWNVGLISCLRDSDHQGAFEAMCAGIGNLIGATQFEVTLSGSMGRGASAEAGLGDVAKASISQMMSLGMQLQVETPNEAHDGKIQAEGTFTNQMTAQLKASIPGVPDGLDTVVGYLAGNASARAQGQMQIGGRMELRLPASPLTDLQAPEFSHVEFFVGAQASARVAREQVAVSSEATVRFGREDLENFEIPDLSDGLTAEELSAALPFTHLAWKGSVALDSVLAGAGLRRLVAGDSQAITFLTGQPSVGGKVELELKFTKANMVQLLVDLGVVRTEDAIEAGQEPEGAAVEALEAIQGANLPEFLSAVSSAAQDFGGFLWNSLDKIKVELHGDANHRTPDIPINSVEVSAGVRLRAAYSATYGREDIEAGISAVRGYLQRALPDDIGRYLLA